MIQLGSLGFSPSTRLKNPKLKLKWHVAMSLGMHGPQLSKSALLLGGRVGHHNRESRLHGHNKRSNGERFACNPTKGFLQTYEGESIFSTN